MTVFWFYLFLISVLCLYLEHEHNKQQDDYEEYDEGDFDE